jgi:hypothetical protein
MDNLDSQQDLESGRQETEQEMQNVARNQANKYGGRMADSIDKKIYEKTGKDLSMDAMKDKAFNSPLFKKLGIKPVDPIIKGIEETVAASLKGAAAAYGTPLLIIILVLCIIPFSLFALVFGFNENPKDLLKDEQKDAIAQAYKDEINEGNKTGSEHVWNGKEYILGEAKKSVIVDYLNAEPYNCGGVLDDFVMQKDEDGNDNPSSYKYVTNACAVTIKMTPDIDTAAKAISAYGRAIDGTVAFYTPVNNGSSLDKNYSYTKNEDGSYTQTYDNTDTQKVIDNPSDYVTSEKNDDGTIKTKEITLDDGTKATVPDYSTDNDNFTELAKDAFGEKNSLKDNQDEFLQSIKDSSIYIFDMSTEPSEWSVNIQKGDVKTTQTYCKYIGTGTAPSNGSHAGVIEDGDTIPTVEGRVLDDGTLTAPMVEGEQLRESCDKLPGQYSMSGQKYVKIKDGKVGTIAIPMHFSMPQTHTLIKDENGNVTKDITSSYRGLELSNIEDGLVAKGGACLYNDKGKQIGSDHCTQEEAETVVNNTIQAYYTTTLQSFGSAGSLAMFNGFNGSLNGDASIAEIAELGDNVYYPAGTDQCIAWWNRIHSDIFANGLAYYAKDPTTCTNFAHWRFWLQYGYDCGNGDGGYVAENTVNKYPDIFELVRYPVAGSIVSFRGGSIWGHVGFIEKVEDGYVWWSDGNVSGGGIRFNTKETIEQFMTSDITVAAPRT